MKSLKIGLWPERHSRRAPQGARGLKYRLLSTGKAQLESRPARGAWVEICWEGSTPKGIPVAPRKGRVG